ncbi:hypothetical protein DFH27DRAFT_485604 [Peziza echinospora]|nr:hypothetical protein DFH27DRAFT_485604 [Peziza echinospora]
MNKISMHSRHSSLGTNSSIHRVARRKSVTSSATNLAAVAQAIKDGGDMQINLPSIQQTQAPANSNHSMSRGGAVGFGGATQHSPVQSAMPPLHGYPSPPPSLPTNGGAGPLGGIGSLPAGGFTFPRKVPLPSPTPTANGISAVNSGSPPSTASNGRRVRRASEGANALLGGQGSDEAARAGKGGAELKCDKCGKGYKHSSCLTKHLWEHTPEWSLTSKLLISKHQQVQLLEAASILVSMNPLGTDDINGNPTPAVSTSSNSINDQSSAASSGSEDTPPPTDHHSSAASVTEMDLGSPLPTPRSTRVRTGSKRHHTSNGVGASRSSHHSGAPPLLVGSVPTHISPGSSFPSHFVNRPHTSRQRAGSFVNTTRTATAAAAAAAAADEESLAAAVELLSCSFGATPLGSTPVLSPRHVMGSPPPPMGGSPDVVMKIEETDEEEVTSGGGAYYHGGMDHRGNHPHSPGNDDEMAVDDDEEEEDSWRQGGRMSTRAMMRRSRRKSDEEEDGVFGKMEE